MSWMESVTETGQFLGIISSKNKENKKLSEIWTLKVVLSLVSAGLFAYEILLTRYFSILLTHNLVYVVVSIALFGIGMGAYISYGKLIKKTEVQISQLLKKDLVNIIGFMVLFFVIGIFVSYIPFVIIYALFAALPFVYGGKLFATIYKLQGNVSYKLYFLDMIGAVVGCSLLIWMMNAHGFYAGLGGVFLFLSLAMLILHTTNADTNIKGWKTASVFTIAILLMVPEIGAWIDSHFAAYQTSPYTGIKYMEETYKSPVDIVYSEWGAFSRTDVIKFDNDAYRLILTDGGASAPMMKYNGNIETQRYLESDVRFLPHGMGKNDKSLLIGSGGGKDVLFALLGKSTDITAVEINESTIRAVDTFKDYNGDIYGLDEVELIVGDGRKFVDETSEKFDHIYLSMLMSNALDNSRMSLVENYIFTEEAFKSYYKAIEDDGRISFMVHNGNEAYRVANTWIKTLVDQGVKLEETPKYFTIVNGMKNHGPQMNIHMPTVILKKRPFTNEEVTYTTDFLTKQMISGIHLPTYYNAYYQGISEGSMTFENMATQLSINLKPVTDNQPYFYKYTSMMPNELIPLGLAILIVGLFFSFKLKHEKIKFKQSSYFILIGLGYILIEIGLIQVLQRYFEKPVLSFSAVLIGLLAGSGVGALISHKMSPKLKGNQHWIFIMIFLFSGIGIWRLQYILEHTMYYELPIKLGIVMPGIFLLGLIMGMPFPLGIQRLHKHKKLKGSIPIMYGVNGIASVAGSILAAMFAMNIGFVGVVMSGAIMYLILGLSMKTLIEA